MKKTQHFGLFRTLEQVGLLLLVCGLIFLLWRFANQGTVLTLSGGTASVVSLVGFLLYWLSGRKITQKIDLLTSQSDFAIDAQFMALFERSPVPYVIIDNEGEITKINQVAVKLFRSTVDDMVQTNLLDRFKQSEDSDVSITINKVKAGITLNDVEIAIQPDIGEKIWVLFSSYTSPHNDQSFISLVDVTQAKKIDEAKSEFLALATHQLRTPISAIRWNTELLKKHIPEQIINKTTNYVEKIQRNTERMSDLVNDFLNVSKLELGTFATEPKQIKVPEFLDSIVEEFTQKFEEKNIVLQRSEQPSGISFQSDERLLHIVVSNLLSNATKYVKESGTIWLETEEKDNRLRMRIADNGIGIPKAEVEKLFSKFYRASNAAKHQAEGTGLGLYVVKQALELLGGTVEVTTDSDQGAEFFVSIPLR